ncbi:hypothetical protein NP493_148g04010 [Ridgeia piscesae]|uniref:HD domain-containing protein n=1 Tax=Ridgeia piscesae TaxID=27915 RepID=A0AAD9UG18_RIDPI|nr:hypothetical protein NP493_148g04010 [Ridgeia piscesae]
MAQVKVYLASGHFERVTILQGVVVEVFNDCVHGHVELDPLCVAIIDTPQFQRLRHIKQLGGSYYVFPGASHNRFEHSIGVCFLAGQLIETLKSKQPELNITDREVLCVKIAGLCHDLGHGPFSHLFDRFLHQAAPHLRSHKNIDRPAEEIDGGSDDSTFFYEIVANKKNGVDVDKWDYFARDCHHLGITNNFDHTRVLKFARVIEVDGRKHICFRDKEERSIYNMFYTRTVLHQRAYQHVVCHAVEIMLTDALLKANDHLMIYGKEESRPLKMSECMDDMEAFSQLTDHVYHLILHGSPKNGLREAADILRRLERRELYRCISHTRPRSCPAVVRVEEISKRVVELSQGTVAPEDFKISVVKFDYGMCEKNPVDSVLFYKKKEPEKAVSRGTEEPISLLLPSTFCEFILRFFWKKSDASSEHGRLAFEAWLQEDGSWQKSES